MCIKYPLFTLVHPFRYDVHKTLAFSFLSRERRFSRVAAVSAFRRDSDREKLGRLRATHPFAFAFSYVLLTVSRPLNHAEAYKESDVRSCLFSPVYFSSPLSTSFSNVSHPEAIYLICFLMQQTKEIKNSSLFLKLRGARSFICEKETLSA